MKGTGAVITIGGVGVFENWATWEHLKKKAAIS